MFGKLFKSRKQMIMFALLVVLAFLVFQRCGGRKLFYGAPIEIREKSTKSLSELEAKEECLENSYYTQFGPRGVCQGQATVNDHMNWELVSGIGSD